MTKQERMPERLFERCRGIDAARVARDAGLEVVGQGARRYCRCPFHGEKNPSMLLDGHGRWYCFGCGRGGDAVALYAGIHGMGMVRAARALAEKYLGEALYEQKAW